MKKLLLLIAGFAFAHQLQAASVNVAEPLVTGGKIPGGSFPHFLFIPDDNGNTQPNYMRLVSYAHTVYNGSNFLLQDSMQYEYYDNSRGGGIVADDITSDEKVLFDESYTYVRGISGMVGVMKRTQAYDIDNQVLNLTYMPWREKGWADSARYLYGYNDHKMTISALEVYVAHQWDPHIKSNMTYNATGRISEMEATMYRMSFTYDANGNLAELIEETRLLTGIWINKSKTTYSYGSSGMTGQTLENWDGSAWVFESKWEYTYFASKIETVTEYDRISNAWLPTNKYIYTYGNKLQRNSEILQVWNANTNTFDNNKYTEYKYANSDDLLLTDVTTQHWQSSNWVVGVDDEHYHYNYQPYFPTSVERVVAENGVRLFPVPAANTLHVNIDWNNAETFNVVICDMRGVVVKNWAEQPVRNYSRQIDVSDLPSGNYVIRANSSSAQLTERFIVAK
ncbi:MAG: T9SS type A sorting domain-containing protein [Sphingobacteriales bacterium]|nr:MAG: T9SS type A sorting domain-containing protein [Sphingobacteriales bacterium]